jgi:SAM-dependent methyltransferase
MSLSQREIHEAVLAVYNSVGQGGSRAPSGLDVATGGDLARALGYRPAELACLPPHVLDAFVGAAALANAVPDAVPDEVEDSRSRWVLDLGCGAGVDGLILAARGFRVAALDASAAMLALAPPRASRLAVRAALPELPVATGLATWALLNGVANLVPARAALLREVFRALRPGGVILAADLVQIGPIPLELRALPEAWAWCVAGAATPEEWREELARAGFEDCEVTVIEEFSPLARAVLRARKSP